MISDKEQNTYAFLFLLPLLFFFLSAGVVFFFPHSNAMHLGSFFVAFAFSVTTQLYIFRKKILPNFVALQRFRQIVTEQEKSAQLLVRRDLELTRANEQLRSLDEVKSGFISVVAHQLRTPLSGIKWTLNLLQNGDLGPLLPEQKKFLVKAYESNDRMIGLVNDLLGADRIDSGKANYTLTSIDLTDAIESALYEIAPQVAARELAVEFKKSETPFPPVLADAERIRAVLQNLLENAVKYSRPKGIIAVMLSRSDAETALVSIKDNGIGIPKDAQEHIFSRFFRAKNAVNVETDGSGLGLYIAKAIIERHGGKIWFSSQEGTTFFFTIPLAK